MDGKKHLRKKKTDRRDINDPAHRAHTAPHLRPLLPDHADRDALRGGLVRLEQAQEGRRGGRREMRALGGGRGAEREGRGCVPQVAEPRLRIRTGDEV